MTETPHEFESSNQTPLLLKYRIDFCDDICELLDLQEIRDSKQWVFEITEEWNSDKTRNSYLTFLRDRISKKIIVNWNVSLRIPKHVFKVDRNRIWFRLDILTGQTVIGEIWLPVFDIFYVKGTMMRIFDCSNIDHRLSTSKVYKSLQDYEREKAKYLEIDLVADGNSAGSSGDKFIRIDDNGDLVYPVRFRKYSKTGGYRISTMTLIGWGLLESYDNNQGYDLEFTDDR